MSLQSATMPFPARLKTSLAVDPVILALSMLLLLGGMVVLASASISISDGATGDPFYYIERQALAAVLGAAGGLVCLYVPLKTWRALGPLLLLVGLALLIVVLVPGVGHSVNGSTRWLRVGFINLQVSEPARLCLLLYLAGYLVRRNRSLHEGFTGFLRPMLLLSLACALLLAEPDFGAAIVLLTTALAMLFVAGARLRDFCLFFGVAVIAMAALAVTSPPKSSGSGAQFWLATRPIPISREWRKFH
jgi:cell division protein FtsW